VSSLARSSVGRIIAWRSSDVYAVVPGELSDTRRLSAAAHVSAVRYRVDGTGAPVFRQSAAPSAPDLQALLERIALRIGQTLEKRGLIERDIENAWLAEDGEGGPLDDPLGWLCGCCGGGCCGGGKCC